MVYMVNIPKTVAVSCLAWSVSACLAMGAQKIEQAKDKSVTVETSVYSVAIDSQGNLTELSVKGLPFATSNFSATPNTKEPNPFENVSISVSGTEVVVSAGNARTQFSFGEDTINVATEGYGFVLFIEPIGKRALVQRKGEGEKFLQLSDKLAIGGGVKALALDNNLLVAFSVPFHSHGNRIMPGVYTSGGNLTDGVEFSMQLGAPAPDLPTTDVPDPSEVPQN